MQEYKSKKNLDFETKQVKQLLKQRGEIPFELSPNTSCKIPTKFTRPYTDLPFIQIALIISQGDEFSVAHSLTQRTLTDFTVNLQNSGIETVKGIVLWCSC